MTMKEDVLRQLLDELLSSTDENAPIGHGLSKEDLDINKQVIELVFNAGLLVLAPGNLSDDLLVQATRSLAAIRLTMRKDPEVLLLKVRDVAVIDWVLIRLCYLLYQIKNEDIRLEIIGTGAAILKAWKEGSPTSWGEVRKCNETLKSYCRSILLDLGNDESMKEASASKFNITLPSKGSFELRLTRPFSAFVLLFSLIHLLSLSVSVHDYQWLVAKLSETDRNYKKWSWFEGVEAQKREIHSIRLAAVTVLFQQIVENQQAADNALRVLLKALQEILLDGHLITAQSTIAKVVRAILQHIKEKPQRQPTLRSCGLELILRRVSDDTSRLPADLQRDIQEIVQLCQLKPSAVTDGPPSKRRSLDNASITIDDLLNYTLATINVPRRASQDHILQLDAIITDSWQTLDEPQRCKLAEAVGLFSCTAAGKLRWKISTSTDSETVRCAICESGSEPVLARQPLAFDLGQPLKSILSKKLSPPVILAAIQAYGRLLIHDMSNPVLRISTSVLATNVLKLLSSQDRSLRIAVVQILPLLFKDRDVDSIRDVISENRQSVFKHHLRDLLTSAAQNTPLLETTVMAYGAIGKVASQTDQHLILSNLVDFLGHNNSFIAALAYREILAIATTHRQSTWQMFSPFWSTISVKVVEQMISRPQILARISDILEIRDSAFLTRTQNFTVPVLVAGGHRDILIHISNKMNVQVWELLKTNMPFVLAGLFTQERGKSEFGVDFMINLMSANKSSGAGKPLIDTRSLIFSSRTPLTIELLKMLGTESDAKRERVFGALQIVATYVMDKPLGDMRTKSHEILKLYLQNNVLELMNHFTDIITDKKGRKTFTEKIGCIAGIQEIVRFASVAAKAALPQIIACFQTALTDDVLRLSAIQAWGTLVENHQAAEVGSMLAHMLAIFMEIWPKCTDHEKDMIRLVIEDAIGRYEEIIMTDYSIPSLAGIPELEKIAQRLDNWREKAAPRFLLELLLRRCNNETAVICYRGLIELRDYLTKQEAFIHSLINAETCDKLITQLLRCLLDVIAKYHDTDPNIMAVAVECLGIVGAVDPSRADAAKEAVEISVQHNFEDAEESISFAMALIEHRLMGSFRSATDTKAQGYLAWAMQELLVFCGFTPQGIDPTKGLGANHLMMRKWGKFSKPAREILTPLLTSKYSITTTPTFVETDYPIFPSQKSYREWLQTFTLVTLKEAQGDNARKIFTLICSRIIKDQDLRISNFVLPYALINVVVSGTDTHRQNIEKEFLSVLESIENAQNEQESAKSRLACQSVFNFIDNLSKWLRQHRRAKMEYKQMVAKKANRFLNPDEIEEMDQAERRVAALLSQMPHFLMSNASFRCGSYARALFYWEQRYRSLEKKDRATMDSYNQHWQTIYSRLEEPDGIEGISLKFTYRNFEQQILEHETAGHWSAAQSLFELEMEREPYELRLHKGLLNSIKQTGHHEIYLHQIDNLIAAYPDNSKIYCTLAIESAWMTGKWGELRIYLDQSERSGFEYQLGKAILAMWDGNDEMFNLCISEVQRHIGDVIVATGTDSSRQCYDALAKLHAVQDLKSLGIYMRQNHVDRRASMGLLDERLKYMIPIPKYQQFALAIRRTAINILTPGGAVADLELAPCWLASAKIARKTGQFDEAYSAILRATEADTQLGTIERARWWWAQGQSRKAIECLQTAFTANVFDFKNRGSVISSGALSLDEVARNAHSQVEGKALSLLTRWLDMAKQTNEDDLLSRYRKLQAACDKWEKSHYLLGHYYNRLLEHEETKPNSRQRETYLTGELTKLVCHCYLRSLSYGSKYLYETLPRVLTLWLDFGANVNIIVSTKEDRQRMATLRQQMLGLINDYVDKCIKKLPVYLFLTTLAQLLSRVTHQNEIVSSILIKIIVTIVCEYPEQTMWSLVAVLKSNNYARALKGQQIVQKLKASSRRSREDMLRIAQHALRFSEALLKLCNFEITGRRTTMSLSKELGFPTHSVMPCPLVVPLQSNLTVILPTNSQKTKKHNPYPVDQPTLQTFEDEVEIMNSMQKPRKLTVRGSDGVRYPFLVKPKDDLRKDARLMEFNGIINKLLKKDADSNRRQLYIRTYSVVPLNEEHGVVEWVPHTRVLRDIILRYLRQKGIQFNYTEIRAVLDSTLTEPSPADQFANELLPKYPPVLWEWFVDEFPGPTAWFESRTKFARTLAVMSFVGYVLGLGDRHSENILLDATSGAAVHVDFNCLFEKGQSFEKPERVPFRLTHNLVDALGVTSYDGVFRKAGEVTMRLLRANSDTLMSVLESFIHDPLVEWNRKKKNDKPGIADSENEEGRKALLTIKGKLGGQINKEELPLSPEGQVDELIRMATDPARLVQMYIGKPPPEPTKTNFPQLNLSLIPERAMSTAIGVNGTATKDKDAQIIVVGGGPVGTLTSLRLARAGIKVLLLEADAVPSSAPRAAVYTGPSVLELQRAGILDDVRALGLQQGDVCWRKVNGEIIAGLDRKKSDDPLNPVTLDQFRLETVILKHIEPYSNAKILWGHKVTALEQDKNGVTITAETLEGKTKKFTSEYVIGADGGRSTIRKLIDVKFEGFTWPWTIIATNVYYPFRENGFWSAQFIVDPEHWALLCHLDRTGLWRVSYGEVGGLTNKEYMERLPAKFEALFPGPKPVAGKWELKSMSPYKIHQRCADTFRKGRVLLAGDAAHLCNPFGGLGLTGGILDAGCLADAFEGIYNESQPDSILDKYSEIRRDIYLKYTDPWSQANVKRLYSLDPETAYEDPFMKTIKEASENEEVKKAVVAGPDVLRVDIRQFFVKPQETKA